MGNKFRFRGSSRVDWCRTFSRQSLPAHSGRELRLRWKACPIRSTARCAYYRKTLSLSKAAACVLSKKSDQRPCGVRTAICPLPKSRPWDPSKIVDLAICYNLHQSRALETFIRPTWWKKKVLSFCSPKQMSKSLLFHLPSKIQTLGPF